MQALVLFDIDATLLKTDGAGVAAMGDAGRHLYGEAFTTDGLDFAGRLDTLIFRDLCRMNGLDRTDAAEREFRAVYGRMLGPRLASSTLARALPGAKDLVNAVRYGRGHAMGLLTGNYRETGSMKLSTCGLEPTWFEVCAWGDDSPHDPPAREHLPPVAMVRFREKYNRAVDPRRVTIIGDTPHDVRCAHMNGCRSIAVATGKFSVAELRDTGADCVVENLIDTNRILTMLA